MHFLRRHAETVVVAFFTATVAAAVPAIALINAATLNGFRANQLVRASYKVNNTSEDFDVGTDTTILSKTAKAPAKGILVLWGNVDAEWKTGTGSTTLQARFLVDGSPVGIPETEQQIDNTGGFHSNSVALSVAVEVTKGDHTVELQAYNTADAIVLQGRSMTTLFVPFGNGGRQGQL